MIECGRATGSFLRRPPRHLPTLPPRLRQPNRNRLFAARHLFSGTPALKLSMLPLVHRSVHLLLCLLSIPGHVFSWLKFLVTCMNITAILLVGLLKCSPTEQ